MATPSNCSTDRSVTLLTVAAGAGWMLEEMIERGPSAATIERFADTYGQEQIPTLAGFRWRRAASGRTAEGPVGST